MMSRLVGRDKQGDRCARAHVAKAGQKQQEAVERDFIGFPYLQKPDSKSASTVTVVPCIRRRINRFQVAL